MGVDFFFSMGGVHTRRSRVRGAPETSTSRWIFSAPTVKKYVSLELLRVVMVRPTTSEVLLGLLEL